MSRCRAGAGGLAAELRADRAPGAGHEHRLAAQVLGDRAKSTSTGSRPRMSSTSTGRIWRGEVVVAGDELVQARQRLHRDLRVARVLDDPAGAPHRKRTGWRSAARRAGCRAGCAGGPRSSRARGRHGGGCSSCAGRRRRRRSACSRAARDFCISRITSWPASPAPTTTHLLAAGDEARRAWALEDRPREQARPGDEREQSSQSRIATPRGSRAVSAGREEVDDEARGERRRRSRR